MTCVTFFFTLLKIKEEYICYHNFQMAEKKKKMYNLFLIFIPLC